MNGPQIAFVLLVIIIAVLVYFKFLLINPCAFNTCSLIYYNNSYYVTLPLSKVIIYNGTPYVKNISILDGHLLRTYVYLINDSPAFVIWNTPTYLYSNSYLFFSFPDTFAVHMQLSSSSPLTVYVMTTEQFIEYAKSGIPVSYVEKFSGQHIDFWFNLSTGCAGYVGIITSVSSTTVYPNETAVYMPASHPTGACAS